jgi:hypothetical protein
MMVTVLNVPARPISPWYWVARPFGSFEGLISPEMA